MSLEMIFARRSIRKYQDQPVEKEKLEQLLQAGMAAPSANNRKPWEFVVVDDAEVMAEIQSAMMFGKYNAPAAIVVCANTSRLKNPIGEFWVQDCSAASENILLAAVALGLGSVWLGVHPIHNFEKRITKVLGLPAHITPLNVIYIGYPAEDKPARTQYDPKRVHWNRY